MTALKEYARLETSGLWRSGPDAQRRDVGVSFGDATLVISDSQDRPLTHWSLAAVQRVNPRNLPALFAPDGSDEETLEIEDPEMIRAIEQVQKAIYRSRPKTGRVRWTVFALTTATILWLGIFWLPEALIKQAVAVVPEVNRAQIGQQLLDRTARIAGQPCTDPFGTVSLRRLQAAIAPAEEFHVLRNGLATTASLPGGHILIGRDVIEDYDDPSVVAGFAVVEMARARLFDPLEALLRATGPTTAFRLLTTGSVPDDALDAYAEMLLTAPRVQVPDEALLIAFRATKVPARPYAFAIDITGEETLALIEADPFLGVAPVTHLDDGEWISLQGICQS